MTKYIRYIIALALFASLFITHQITIPYEVINTPIQKALPIEKNKKGAIIHITKLDIKELKGQNISSRIVGSIKMSDTNILKTNEKASNMFNKFSKFIGKEDLQEKLKEQTLNFDVDSEIEANIKGYYMHLKIISIDTDNSIVNKFQGVIKGIVKHLKFKIQKIADYSWIATVKGFEFNEDQDLVADLGVNKFIIFLLMMLFLLREIGLGLINFYQAFLSDKKGYKCAKGALNGTGTCSGTTKQAFQESGFIKGMMTYFSSKKECKTAYDKHKASTVDVGFGSCIEGMGVALGSCAKGKGGGVNKCDDFGDCDLGHC